MSLNTGAGAAAGYSPDDPSVWSTLSASALVIGLNIGMMSDHSALVLAGAWPEAIGIINVVQFPLSTPHEQVASVVATIASNTRVKVVFDASNNSAFASILAARMPRQPVNRLIAAVITGAHSHAAGPEAMPISLGNVRGAVPRWTLSKSELIEAIAAEMGNHSLRIGHKGDWETLQDELASLERTVRASGSASYAAPVGKHDDCVLALALAVFGCRRLGRPALRRRLVQARVGAAGWT